MSQHQVSIAGKKNCQSEFVSGVYKMKLVLKKNLVVLEELPKLNVKASQKCAVIIVKLKIVSNSKTY